MEKPKAEYPNRICSFKWYPQKEMDAFLEEQAAKRAKRIRAIAEALPCLEHEESPKYVPETCLTDADDNAWVCRLCRIRRELLKEAEAEEESVREAGN